MLGTRTLVDGSSWQTSVSIERRTTKSGTRYEVRLRDGTGREYSRSFKTRKEAEAFQARERADRSRGTWIDPRRASTTFSELAAWWVDVNPAKRASTRSRDEAIIRLHINPEIGNRAVATITPVDIRRLVAAWSQGRPPSTTHRQFAVVRAVFAAAVDAEYLVRTPCRGIRLPPLRRVARPEVTPVDVTSLAGAAGEWAPLVLVAAVLGLRWGECAGLRVCDVDFFRSSLRVTQQVAAGSSAATAPKSTAGRRVLSMPSELTDVLAQHLRHRGLSGAEPERFVFGNEHGGPLDYANFRRRVWLPACREAGLDGLTFHDLRRANATAMALEGVDVKTGQTRLGQSDPRLYLETYAQATGEGDLRAAQRLGARFFTEVEETGESRRRLGESPT